VAVLAGFGDVPILTVPAKKAADALPPAVKVTLAGRNDGAMLLVTPVPGSTPLTVIAAVRVTVPAKFPTLVSVIVVVTEPPLGIVTPAGPTPMVKSWLGTLTESAAPPVTVRL
jgi:hypothetical protein